MKEKRPPINGVKTLGRSRPRRTWVEYVYDTKRELVDSCRVVKFEKSSRNPFSLHPKE